MKTLTQTDKLIDSVKKVHMIGIGGAGMCPLAEILHSKGYEITGSDNNPSDTLNRIIKLGIPVQMGHAPENVHGAELVIHSAAIMQDNPELVEARRLNIPTVERSLLLGAITRKYNDVIGVCGTHGKTSTTSMITQILIKGNLDPSAVIGGKLQLIDSYCRVGKSQTIVCESCEYVNTFHQMSPDVAVLLNIDNDHLEFFKTMDNLTASFHKFLSMATRTVIVNGDDMRAMSAAENVTAEVITFGTTDKCDYYPGNVQMVHGAFGKFDLMYKGKNLGNIELNVPGEHQIMNALAAAAAAINSGADFEAVQEGLSTFAGAGRRFEILYRKNGLTVADDYAHHPTELKVTLSAAKKMDFDRVIAVFQPFTFSRTAMLLDDFAEVLSIADEVVLSPIMGSREINTYNIHSSDLAAKLKNAKCFDTFEEIADYLKGHTESGDLVISLGCGDIYKATKLFIKKISE